MSKSYLITYDIHRDRNQAFFWNEAIAKAFIEAIKPLQFKDDLLQVFTVDAYDKNFYNKD